MAKTWEIFYCPRGIKAPSCQYYDIEVWSHTRKKQLKQVFKHHTYFAYMFPSPLSYMGRVHLLYIFSNFNEAFSNSHYLIRFVNIWHEYRNFWNGKKNDNRWTRPWLLCCYDHVCFCFVYNQVIKQQTNFLFILGLLSLL